jgi:outer membrane biogenesis lipoprotein LolB
MRAILFLAIVLLAACSKQAEAPTGNEQAVIDKANADVAAAEGEARIQAPPESQAPPAALTAVPDVAVSPGRLVKG